MKNFHTIKIGILGMGYVGLPLAVEFSQYFNVIGFDIDIDRVSELKSGNDSTREVSVDQLKNADKLKLSSSLSDLVMCNVFIVTVPTPIDEYKRPNLKPLLGATASVGEVLREGDVVIYESTVYPGATEDDCVPILEGVSGLTLNKDFYVGYSPERINPGDKEHSLTSIVKVTSGSNPYAAEFVDDLYSKIIIAGTYKAASIKEAEAAKVIENTQRDLNIALINELSILFDKLNIDTQDVLDAAKTKWNFLPFKPGLVGGHCIGVDPYYLTFKAENIGYKTKVILAGRELNDSMGGHIASKFILAMKRKKIKIKKSRILIMGLTFKENCADIRNSGVKSLFESLKKFNCNLDIYDPWTNLKDVKKIYNITPIKSFKKSYYDGVVIAVAHNKFKTKGINFIQDLCKKNSVIYDLKNLFKSKKVDLKL